MANTSTQEVIEKGEKIDVMYITIESTIALASVIGNVLVVLVVAKNQGMRDPTFCFIVSLALADIAVGVLVIPLAVSSILSLLAIAIDRFLRVKIPTR
ncbi:Adenosine receptor A1 [Triplophysa tibetana]|uniref:Adenosine receptor A1 n=1 Tax=Triplophysa tibetana TaxID=1572043 RepID=A0A5A9NYV6_9TELE|nr:Adenosine receptor A1 [Triplophysa tibetana]